jgi:hypothetical protein
VWRDEASWPGFSRRLISKQSKRHGAAEPHEAQLVEWGVRKKHLPSGCCWEALIKPCRLFARNWLWRSANQSHRESLQHQSNSVHPFVKPRTALGNYGEGAGSLAVCQAKTVLPNLDSKTPG